MYVWCQKPSITEITAVDVISEGRYDHLILPIVLAWDIILSIVDISYQVLHGFYRVFSVMGGGLKR